MGLHVRLFLVTVFFLLGWVGSLSYAAPSVETAVPKKIVKIVEASSSQGDKSHSSKELLDRKAAGNGAAKHDESPDSAQKWRSILDIVTVHNENKKPQIRQAKQDVGPVEKYSGLPMVKAEPPAQPVPSVHVEAGSNGSEATPDSKVAQLPPPVGMPQGVRAASLIERLSSGVQGFGGKIAKSLLVATGVRKIVPEIYSMNETMIVVHVPAPANLGNVPRKNIRGHVVVNRVSLTDGKLQIQMKSRRLPRKNAKAVASVPSVSVDTVHVLNVDADAVTDTGSVRVERLSSREYSIYIPVENLTTRKTTEVVAPAETEVVAPAETEVAASAETAPPKVTTPEGGHEEEDTYEFLKAHESCKTEIGAPGLRTSLCTCERRHAAKEELHTACIGRVVDRSVRIAKRLGDDKIAKKIYKAALKCRQTREGDVFAIKARKCLLKVVSRHITGKFPELDKESSSSARKLLSALATEEAENEETESELGSKNRDQFDTNARSRWTVVAGRLGAVIVYSFGIGVLLFGLSDITRHYRRHQSSSQRREQFTQLPDTARALYSRLFS